MGLSVLGQPRNSVVGQDREFIRVQIGRGTHQQDVAGFNGFVCGHESGGCRVFSLLRLNSP
jgi:hypothetical protein